jgi:hypothetical protein
MLSAQAPLANVSNPRAIEFEIAVQDRADVVGYRLEIFAIGSETPIGQFARLMDFRRASISPNGFVRIDLGNALDGLGDGIYVATLKILGPRGESARSAPTEPFVVTGLSNRPSPRPLVLTVPSTGRPPAPPPSPPPPPDTADTDTANESHSKFWTIVGIAMAAAAILVPLLR